MPYSPGPAVTLDDDFHTSPLWTFSLQHYAKAGVKDACLVLQDRSGLDVNVALACLWHERRGGTPLSEEDIKGLLEAAVPAQQRVQAIRSLRRDAGHAAETKALYRALKRAELLAENLLQRVLYEALRGRPVGDPTDGRASLLAYAAQQRKTLPPAQVEAFAVE